MNNLQMQKVCAKMMPKVLTDDQRSRRLETCQELWNLCESDPHFLDNVITNDKSWVFEYDPKTKRQSVEWHTWASSRAMKARMSKSKIKTMVIVFFDIRGLVHHKFVPYGITTNAKFYVEVLKRLKKVFIVSGLKSQTMGICTTTMSQPTPPSLWHNFWLIQKLQRFPATL